MNDILAKCIHVGKVLTYTWKRNQKVYIDERNNDNCIGIIIVVLCGAVAAAFRVH